MEKSKGQLEKRGRERGNEGTIIGGERRSKKKEEQEEDGKINPFDRNTTININSYINN